MELTKKLELWHIPILGQVTSNKKYQSGYLRAFATNRKNENCSSQSESNETVYES